MTDEAPAAAHGADTQKPAPGAVNFQFTLTEDGKSTQIIISLPNREEPLIIEMDAAGFFNVQATMSQIVDHMRTKKVLPPAQATPFMISKWMIGRSNEPRFSHFTVLNIDEGLSTGSLAFMADLDALKLADAIEQQVFHGMSEVDKMKMIEEAQKGTGKPHGLILPGKLKSN